MSSFTRRAAACVIAALCGAILLTVGGYTSPSITASEPQSPSTANAESDEQQARVTCGGCHAFPPPEILPRDAWRDEFVRMMFIREGRLPPAGIAMYRTIQLPPDMAQASSVFYPRA